MDGDLITHEDLSNVRELMHQNLAIAQENNILLKRMQHWGRVAFWAKVAIWAIVLAIPLLVYTWFAPIVKIIPTEGRNLFGLPAPAQIEQGLQQYTASK